MIECVVDASALVLALAAKTEGAGELRGRLLELRIHAPHLIDAEVANVLRRHERDGLLSEVEARAALRAGHALVRHRHPHAGALAELAWRWRHNLSFYDALYVALAALLDVPLLTADSRLAGAPGQACTIELV